MDPGCCDHELSQKEKDWVCLSVINGHNIYYDIMHEEAL